MTVEATITRTLSIRFIDARNLATTAKLNLGITQYPTSEQQKQLIKEATRVFFEDLSSDDRSKMKSDNVELISAISNNGASTSSLSTSSERWSASSDSSVRSLAIYKEDPSIGKDDEGSSTTTTTIKKNNIIPKKISHGIIGLRPSKRKTAAAKSA